MSVSHCVPKLTSSYAVDENASHPKLIIFTIEADSTVDIVELGHLIIKELLLYFG